MTDSPRPVWTLLAALGGVVVLATVGAPQSLEYLLRTGVDTPATAETQLAVGACGAVATALAVLARRFWRWLLPAGAIGVLIAAALHLPTPQEVTARVAGSTTNLTASPLPACLLAAGSGVLLIGLLGAARSIVDSRPLTGIIAAAAYYGVAVVGPLGQASGAARLTVTAVAALLTAAVFVARAPERQISPTTQDSSGGRGWPAAVVVLLPVGSTLVVAVTGKQVLGSSTGGLFGILLVVLALAGSPGAKHRLAVAASGLVLAAPATLLLFLHSAPATGRPWYAWPLALLGVVGGAAVSRRSSWAAVATVAAAVPMVALGLRVAGENRAVASFLAWAFVVLALAAVSAVTGASAPRAQLPQFAALVTTAAVGFTSAAGLFADHTSGLGGLLGPGMFLVSAGYTLVAAALLVVLGRVQGKGPQATPPHVSGAAAERAQQ